MHLMFYTMRMSDFAYGLLGGICLVNKLNRDEAKNAPTADVRSDVDNPKDLEMTISCQTSN